MFTIRKNRQGRALPLKMALPANEVQGCSFVLHDPEGLDYENLEPISFSPSV
jgi:hypothetical protein